MKCDSCSDAFFGTEEEILETPNYKFKLCTDCFIELEEIIRDWVRDVPSSDEVRK